MLDFVIADGTAGKDLASRMVTAPSVEIGVCSRHAIKDGPVGKTLSSGAFYVTFL